MTTLTLDKVAIAPVSDLSDILFVAQTTEDPSITVNGEVQTYSMGRRRAVGRAGSGLSVPFSFSRLPRADYDRLVELVGLPVLVRDQRGRAIYGVFFSLGGSEVAVRDTFVFDVSLTLEHITYSEIV